MSDCEKCGKDLDEHPMIDVSSAEFLQMCDRHPKWQRVDPGTVIPAGQPYRKENPGALVFRAVESVNPRGAVTVDSEYPSSEWFVDSSWKPPLVLPTEPTWALVLKPNGYVDTLEVWHDPRQGDGVCYRNASLKGWMSSTQAVAIIPLTDEQVARIEAHR